MYERSVTFVPMEDMYDVFCIYLQKTEEYFGVVATRPVYEKALGVVPDADVSKISIRFAEMERQLGELDRARAIFVHGSQTCDPKRYVGKCSRNVPSSCLPWKQRLTSFPFFSFFFFFFSHPKVRCVLEHLETI